MFLNLKTISLEFLTTSIQKQPSQKNPQAIAMLIQKPSKQTDPILQ